MLLKGESMKFENCNAGVPLIPSSLDTRACRSPRTGRRTSLSRPEFMHNQLELQRFSSCLRDRWLNFHREYFKWEAENGKV